MLNKSSDNAGEDEEYIAEKILQMQLRENKRYYLIKWEGARRELSLLWFDRRILGENCTLFSGIFNFTWLDSKDEIIINIPLLSETSAVNYNSDYEKQEEFADISEESDTSDENFSENDPE